jgi:hypothetical protein
VRKHKYKVILETAGETLNRSYYIVRVEKETFWGTRVYYLSKHLPSKYKPYSTYSLKDECEKKCATIVDSEKEALNLWQDFLDNTDFFIKHPKEPPKEDIPEEKVIKTLEI